HLRAPLRRQPLFFSRSKFSPKLVRCATASAAARSSDAPDAREGPTAAGSELAERTCLAPGEVVSLAVHPILQLTQYSGGDRSFLVRPPHIPPRHFIQHPRRSIERRLAVPHTLSSTRCGLPLRLTCMASQHTASLTTSSLAHELGHKLEHEDLGCYDETKCFSPMLTKSWLFGPSEPIEDVGKRAHCYGHGRRGHKRLHELLPGWGWCRRDFDRPALRRDLGPSPSGCQPRHVPSRPTRSCDGLHGVGQWLLHLVCGPAPGGSRWRCGHCYGHALHLELPHGRRGTGTP